MKWQNVHTNEWPIHVHVNKNYYFHKTFDVTGDKFDKQTNTYRIRLHAALQWNKNVLGGVQHFFRLMWCFSIIKLDNKFCAQKIKRNILFFKILYLLKFENQQNFLDNYWLSCSLSTLSITEYVKNKIRIRMFTEGVFKLQWVNTKPQFVEMT